MADIREMYLFGWGTVHVTFWAPREQSDQIANGRVLFQRVT